MSIRADIEVTIRLGRRLFLCSYKPLFSTLFRNNIASSIWLIMIFFHVLLYTTKEWSTMAYCSNTNWLTSHKKTRDTTRAGVNLYLQNGILSTQEDAYSFFPYLNLRKPHLSTPFWNDIASSHRLKRRFTYYVITISWPTLYDFAQKHATNCQLLR